MQNYEKYLFFYPLHRIFAKNIVKNMKEIIITDQDRAFMREAIRLANESVKKGGGPFGAVIVKDGQIVAGGSNRVTIDVDPTAHAEVNTIREACRRLQTFDLSGCVIYTSCEPCPMCLGAIYWAHIDRIYYGNTRKDARDINFADDFIYNELDRPLEERTVPIVPLLRDEALESFRLWTANTDKTEY
jgi:tRNA(Arg) A34 adenosine deaminase TadA